MNENPNTQPTNDTTHRAAPSDARRVDGAAQRSKRVRNLNSQLRTLTEWAPSHDQDCSYNFFCECGCTEPVPLTVAEYDALEGASVYVPGHTPLEKRYGIVIRPSGEAA